MGLIGTGGGFFGSGGKTDSGNTETDARTYVSNTDQQAAQRATSNVAPVSISADGSKNKTTISINQTDYGSINAALDIAENAVYTSSEAIAYSTENVLNFADAASRRNSDLTTDVLKQGSEQLAGLTTALDSQTRRTTDLTYDLAKLNVGSNQVIAEALDAQGRRSADLTTDVLKQGSSQLNAFTESLDSQARRSTDLTYDLAKLNVGSNQVIAEALDAQGRRASDLTLDLSNNSLTGLALTLENIDSQNRRNADLTAGFVQSSENQSRMVTDAVTAANEKIVDVNRQSLDFADRTVSSVASNFNNTLSFLDANDRRTADLATMAFDTVTKGAESSSESIASITNSLSQTTKDILKEQNAATQSLAKSVSVGNEEGTNRIVMTLIISVSLVMLVIGGVWIFGKAK